MVETVFLMSIGGALVSGWIAFLSKDFSERRKFAIAGCVFTIVFLAVVIIYF